MLWKKTENVCSHSKTHHDLCSNLYIFYRFLPAFPFDTLNVENFFSFYGGEMWEFVGKIYSFGHCFDNY